VDKIRIYLFAWIASLNNNIRIHMISYTLSKMIILRTLNASNKKLIFYICRDKEYMISHTEISKLKLERRF
jgi:hypothetical protein